MSDQKIEAVVEAARLMLASWDHAVPHINAAVEIATIHSCPYTGPIVLVEPLREALTKLDNSAGTKGGR